MKRDLEALRKEREQPRGEAASMKPVYPLRDEPIIEPQSEPVQEHRARVETEAAQLETRMPTKP